MKKFICDHCGKEINITDDYLDYELEFESEFFECDLCAECKNKIVTDTIKSIERFIGV